MQLEWLGKRWQPASSEERGIPAASTGPQFGGRKRQPVGAIKRRKRRAPREVWSAPDHMVPVKIKNKMKSKRPECALESIASGGHDPHFRAS